MKSKKGFTLVELLAIIVLLGIIMLIIVPSVTKLTKNTKKKAFESSAHGLLRTAKLYYQEKDMLDEFNGEETFTFPNGAAELEYEGKLPESGTLIINEDGYIAFAISNGKYCAKKGYEDNTITVDNDLENCNINSLIVGPEPSLAPAIVLNGESTTYVEVNTTYNELGATAQTPQGVDLTSNIITTISGSGNIVNTSVVGNQYTITYTITDQGETSTTSRTVIVRDTIAPTLTVPGNATITTDDSTFNLMTGVSGTDNSGEVPVITASSNISFGIPGTYTITYTAKDSSNNTTTKTRNIIVIQANHIDATLNGADPVVKTGMIPVNIAPNGTVTKADTNSEWYNYSQKKWANVVTVTASSRTNYMNATVGTQIQEADILTYLVWVPRYKYKLWNVGTTNPSKTTHSIEITFENKNTTKSNGNTNGTYLTHPAFTFGSEELNGIWVGKFETGYKGATSITGAQQNTVNSAQVVIKPNTYSWRNINVSNAFNTVIGMNGANNAFGLDTATDTHMMKNTEWGAVAYLSHSTYGKDGEVYINNANTYTTGCGANNASDDSTSSCLNAYGSKSDNVYNQSTTGNISGVFDMSGGAYEYVMGYTTGAVACSGGYGECSGFTTSTFPASKYVDTYSSTSDTDYTKRKLGDATGEMGAFSSSVGSWYQDVAYFIDSSSPWFVRGGGCNYSTYAGVFYFGRNGGFNNNASSFRVTIA